MTTHTGETMTVTVVESAQRPVRTGFVGRFSWPWSPSC